MLICVPATLLPPLPRLAFADKENKVSSSLFYCFKEVLGTFAGHAHEKRIVDVKFRSDIVYPLSVQCRRPGLRHMRRAAHAEGSVSGRHSVPPTEGGVGGRPALPLLSRGAHVGSVQSL